MDYSEGSLFVTVFSADVFAPVSGASVRIYNRSDSPDSAGAQIAGDYTDSSGQAGPFPLSAPAPVYSLVEESDVRPYTAYRVSVKAPGYREIIIQDVDILPGETSRQTIYLPPLTDASLSPLVIAGGEHVLWGNYPAKYPEPEIKPIIDSGAIVLSRVVIPEYIIVHDGVPSDKSATDYWVRYTDYIKNVVSSEIYATWPEAAIYANILAIMSFTLNRVYTEYYRNMGYNFTITSTTSYDQKWTRGGTTYANIDRMVDSVFPNYLSRPGVRQPIFTSYCDGKQSSCTGMTQWGSKYLADEGYSAIQILRRYYGKDLFINTASRISGVPVSYPGAPLSIGSSGPDVLTIQTQLNRIAKNFPALPILATDGIYGPATAAAVKKFREIAGLSPAGIVDFATWYAISRYYVGVTRISEPGVIIT